MSVGFSGSTPPRSGVCRCRRPFSPDAMAYAFHAGCPSCPRAAFEALLAKRRAAAAAPQEVDA